MLKFESSCAMKFRMGNTGAGIIGTEVQQQFRNQAILSEKGLHVIRLGMIFLAWFLAGLTFAPKGFALGADCSDKTPLAEMERRADYKPAEMSRWFAADTENPLGAVLLVHGLNQKPSRWQDLIIRLNSMGFHVFRLTLQGHGGAPFENMKAVDAEIWLHNLQAGYCQIEQRYPELKKVLVAFSLGALAAQEFQLACGRRLFSRQVLLAPALRPKSYVPFIKPLVHLLTVIPSRTPRDYRANSNGTASAAYRALFRLMERFDARADYQAINTDTLVLMHPDDELIPYGGIQEIIETRGLNRWQLKTVQNRNSRLKPRFNHLIIDRAALGEGEWKALCEEIAAFLSPP